MGIDYAEISIVALLVTLSAWSAVWFVVGAYKGAGTQARRVYWLTHSAWVFVNLIIASVGFLAVRNSVFDSDLLTLQRNIVAINALLDVGYMLVAKQLQKSSKSLVVQVGEAIFIQGAFLFALDLVFAIIFTLLLL